MKQAIGRTIKAGGKGIKIQVAGRLNGSDMARREYFKEGSIPLHTFNANIDYGQYSAVTTYGIIGITVWVYRGEDTSVKDGKQNEVGNLVRKEQ
jgi:small subunit ribosomal protein S3